MRTRCSLGLIYRRTSLTFTWNPSDGHCRSVEQPQDRANHRIDGGRPGDYAVVLSHDVDFVPIGAIDNVAQGFKTVLQTPRPPARSAGCHSVGAEFRSSHAERSGSIRVHSGNRRARDCVGREIVLPGCRGSTARRRCRISNRRRRDSRLSPGHTEERIRPVPAWKLPIHRESVMVCRGSRSAGTEARTAHRFTTALSFLRLRCAVCSSGAHRHPIRYVHGISGPDRPQGWFLVSLFPVLPGCGPTVRRAADQPRPDGCDAAQLHGTQGRSGLAGDRRTARKLPRKGWMRIDRLAPDRLRRGPRSGL